MSYQYQPLGTIIPSILNYDQLCKAMREKPEVNPATSTYVPCDGRSIVGSALERITGGSIQTAPDLRGKFMRGLNLFYNPGAPSFDVEKYGDVEGMDRQVMSYQADSVGPHEHTAECNINVWSSPGGMGIQSDEGEQAANMRPAIKVHQNNGVESRPRNIAVYYYMRINDKA